ncbi:MAG: hypothetical protein UT33_C0010G0011 [Candidatus Peregrinibacteria bacterium GW2011_GWC2_39_14]|nr:MAG: hypothetical protein US92_C0006G0011 [Candidatus Peregrinibacteria bacterium GW2011_GWA2_38_36]KKR05868.1 MAG: hypothetical protein UT33_C0010G0011 [Candidatus Peregrinibacteria bacterium GW2011_GWC2_39_14]
MQIDYFLKTFKGLRDNSPHVSSASADNENCLYTYSLAYSKNAYCIFLGGWVQDCYYGEFLVKCQDCVDCVKIEQSTLCYECVECGQCYSSNYLLKCNSTQDSEYCINLRNCTHCFLSGNIHHASYVFKNKKYSKKRYEELVDAYKKEKTIQRLYDEWLDLCEKTPRINLLMTQCENCLGDNISFSKDVYAGFDLVKAENFLYSEEGGYGKDCCDTLIATDELHYECFGVTKNSYNCNFCVELTTCVNCEFCYSCYDCSDCFGCVYLKGKKFYILDKPYTEEDYKNEVELLKKNLKTAGFYSFDLMVD